jgi:hypothetical protein
MADEIKIKVGVNSSVSTGIDRVKGDLKSAFGGLKSALSLAGVGLGIGAVVSGVKSLIGYIGQLQDQADQLNIGTTEFQKLSIVASESGVKAQQLSVIMQKLAAAQSDIANNKGAQNAFRNLGISIEDVIASNPAQLLEMIAKGFDKTGDRAAVFDLLGAKAGKFIPVLSEIKDGIDSINREGIINDDEIKKADKLEEKLNSIGRTLKSWASKGANFVMDVVQSNAALLGSLTAGGGVKEARQSLGMDVSKDIASASSQKAIDENIEAEKRVSEYKRKLAKEDAEWIEKIDKEVADKNQKDFADWLEKESAMIQDQKEEELKFEKELRDAKIEVRQDAIKEKEAEIQAVEEVARKREEADAKRREQLQAQMKKAAFGVDLVNAAIRPESWAAERKKERDAERQAKRDAKQVELAQDRFDRGVATDRDLALLGGMNANRRAKEARQAMEQLDKDAKKAAIETADATKVMQRDLQQLKQNLDAIVKG